MGNGASNPRDFALESHHAEPLRGARDPHSVAVRVEGQTYQVVVHHLALTVSWLVSEALRMHDVGSPENFNPERIVSVTGGKLGELPLDAEMSELLPLGLKSVYVLIHGFVYDIPDRILAENVLINFANPRDLCVLRFISRRFSRVCGGNTLWRAAFYRSPAWKWQGRCHLGGEDDWWEDYRTVQGIPYYNAARLRWRAHTQSSLTVYYGMQRPAAGVGHLRPLNRVPIVGVMGQRAARVVLARILDLLPDSAYRYYFEHSPVAPLVKGARVTPPEGVPVSVESLPNGLELSFAGDPRMQFVHWNHDVTREWEDDDLYVSLFDHSVAVMLVVEQTPVGPEAALHEVQRLFNAFIRGRDSADDAAVDRQRVMPGGKPLMVLLALKVHGKIRAPARTQTTSGHTVAVWVDMMATKVRELVGGDVGGSARQRPWYVQPIYVEGEACAGVNHGVNMIIKTVAGP